MLALADEECGRNNWMWRLSSLKGNCQRCTIDNSAAIRKPNCMASAIAFIQWESYAQGADGRGLFASDPLSYNSRQDRLHKLGAGDRLWLVSRCPDDQQYYVVGLFVVAVVSRNPSGS